MEESERKLRGLYDRVNISVSNLNIIIIVLSILLVLCMAIGIANRGYQVDFDSLGRYRCGKPEANVRGNIAGAGAADPGRVCF